MAVALSPRTRFLNACTQSELDVLFQRIVGRTHRWNRYENNRAAIELHSGVRLLDNTGSVVYETHTGQWWMDWAECFIFYPGQAPNPIQPTAAVTESVVQFRHCPAGIRSSLFDQWRGTSTVVKLVSYHISFKQANIGVLLPNNLGSGSSISHYCDTGGCNRRNHLALTLQHQANMQRQRCQGVTLVTLQGVILMEIKCSHDLTNDFSGSCRKFQVVPIDNLAVLFNWQLPAGAIIRGPVQRRPPVQP